MLRCVRFQFSQLKPVAKKKPLTRGEEESPAKKKSRARRQFKVFDLRGGIREFELLVERVKLKSHVLKIPRIPSASLSMNSERRL